MKRELRRWEIVGFAVTGLVGTLLHFVYGWSDGSRVAAAFSAVNESTWEHMKLLFLPYFVFAVVEFIVFSRRSAISSPSRRCRSCWDLPRSRRFFTRARARSGNCRAGGIS